MREERHSLIRAVEDSIDMPACEVSEVLEESLLDVLESLCPLLLSVHVESAHSQCFCGYKMM